jgi:hypothetical protein
MSMSTDVLFNGSYGWVRMQPEELTSTLTLATLKLRLLVKNHEIDALAFCGSSGSALAFHLAILLKIPLMYVRKEQEKSHSISPVECNTDRIIRNYLIVDDLICSGDTVNHIIDSIHSYATFVKGIRGCEHQPIPECKGIFLYADPRQSKFSYGGKEIPVFQ